MSTPDLPIKPSKPSDEQSTPQEFFDGLNNAFNFDLDVCASAENAKCKHYFDIKQDGLKEDWFGRCWMNPPYSNPEPWLQKAFIESRKNRALVVALLRGDTSTKAFHRWGIWASGLFFVEGRLKFNESEGSPNFASLIAVFDSRFPSMQAIGAMSQKGQVRYVNDPFPEQRGLPFGL